MQKNEYVLIGHFKVTNKDIDYYYDIHCLHNVGELSYQKQHALVAIIALSFLNQTATEPFFKRLFDLQGVVQLHWNVTKKKSALRNIKIKFIRIFSIREPLESIFDISFKSEYRFEFDQRFIEQ